MIDIVDVLEGYCNSLDFGFSYGNRSFNNLLQDVEIDKPYLILDPVTESEGLSEYGGDGSQTFTGSFMLVIKSNLDNVYHTQQEALRNEGKYVKNIQPLKKKLNLLKDIIDCSDITRQSWRIVDAIDVLDENMDGVVVNFTFNYAQ